MQQEDKDERLYTIKVEISNSTTSYNKDRAITLISKDENCEELLKLAKKYINDMS